MRKADKAQYIKDIVENWRKHSSAVVYMNDMLSGYLGRINKYHDKSFSYVRYHVGIHLLAKAIRILSIRVKQLEKLHSDGSKFAMMSAYLGNKSNHENKKRQLELIKYIHQLGRKFESVKGIWPADGAYENEGSLLIYGIGFVETMQLGKIFDQQAIIFKDCGGPVVLYDLKQHVGQMLDEFDVSPNVSKPRKQIDRKEDVGAGTRWNQMQLEYTWKDKKVQFSSHPLKYEDFEG